MNYCSGDVCDQTKTGSQESSDIYSGFVGSALDSPHRRLSYPSNRKPNQMPPKPTQRVNTSPQLNQNPYSDPFGYSRTPLMSSTNRVNMSSNTDSNSPSRQLFDHYMDSYEKNMKDLDSGLTLLPSMNPWYSSKFNQPISKPIPGNVKVISHSDTKTENSKENVLIKHLDEMRKSNELFQTSILRELREIKEVLIDLKTTSNELPNKLSESLANTLSSIHSCANSMSFIDGRELTDMLDSINISNDTKDDEEINSNPDSELSDSFENNKKINNKEIEANECINSSTNDKFIFPYDSNIDLNKWLKKD